MIVDVGQVRIAVSGRIRVWRGDLPVALDEQLRLEHERSNPAFHKLKAIGRSVHGVPRTIRTWSEEPGWLVLPRGAKASLGEALARAGLAPLVRDDRCEGTLPAPRGALRWPLRGYQRDMADAAHAAETCILRAPTGSGKTYAAFGLIDRAAVPALVLVPDGALRRQWARRARTEYGLSASSVGEVGDGRFEVRPLTVATIATLARNDGERAAMLSPKFGLVVFDEVQRAAAPTMIRVVDRLACRWRVGISADERRKDSLEWMVRDAFGEVAHEVTEAEVLADKAAVPVDVIMLPTRFAAPWYDPTRRPEKGAEDSGDYARLLDEMCEDDARTMLIAGASAHGVDCGRVVVALTARKRHARKLAEIVASMTGLPSGLLLGGSENQRAYDSAISGLTSGALRFAAGTLEAFGTGVDVPRLDRVVLAKPTSSNRMLLNQVKGRACRPHAGKSRAELVYVLDEAVFPEAESRISRWFPGRVRRWGEGEGALYEPRLA